jgi:hypothetical protein
VILIWHSTINGKKIQRVARLKFIEATNDELEIELSEGSFYETREYDYSVKYFWMLVAPSLFPNN